MRNQSENQLKKEICGMIAFTIIPVCMIGIYITLSGLKYGISPYPYKTEGKFEALEALLSKHSSKTRGTFVAPDLTLFKELDELITDVHKRVNLVFYYKKNGDKYTKLASGGMYMYQ